MKEKFRFILSALAFTMACAAQSVVPPPPDCLSLARKQTAGRSLAATTTDCPPTPGTILGQGTAGVIPVFKTPTTLGDSVISQNPSGGVGVGGANTGTAKLAVTGNIAATGIAATGAVTAGSLTATGNVTANTLTSTGNVTGAD